MSSPSEQLALLESLYAQDPGGRVFLPLGRAYLEAGQPSQAATVLEQGLALHPAELTGRELLAKARLALGQREAALAELMKADQAVRELAGVYRMLSELLPSLGRSAEGLRAAILARELAAVSGATPAAQPEPAEPPAPPPPTETATLAQIYAAQGLTEEAQAIYRRLGRPPQAMELEDQAPEPPAAKPTASRPQRGGVMGRLMALRAAACARTG